MSEIFEKNLQAKEIELLKTQAMLKAYWKAINEIDDYFEYSNKSEEDKKFVYGVIADLYIELKKVGEVKHAM